eukprot:2409067-Rhodomonas_salina.1
MLNFAVRGSGGPARGRGLRAPGRGRVSFKFKSEGTRTVTRPGEPEARRTDPSPQAQATTNP